MNQQEAKCVLVMDENLPTGILANAAAILGITLGRKIPECVGEDVTDASGCIHKGIISIPVPVLKGNAGLIKTLREKLYSEDFRDLTVVDFSDVSQSCNTYDVYIQKAGTTREEDYTYLWNRDLRG